MFEGLFTAEDARRFAKMIADGGPEGYLMRELVGKIGTGRSTCDCFLGREIGREEAMKRMDTLRDLGFTVSDYRVCRDNKGDPREPFHTFPPEYRCTIHW